MKAAFTMWKYPRMLILTAICAALYAVAISVLKTPPPLSTRLIGQLMPMPLGLLFGPAGAWGVAIGDTVSEFITGGLSIGSVFGFFGNFLLGYLPYVMWTRLRPLATGNRETSLKSVRGFVLYFLVAAGSAFACAVFLSWPLERLGFVAYPFLVNLIGVQDALVGFVAILLLLLIYRRVEALGLVYWEVMKEGDLDNTNRKVGVVGAWLVLIVSVVAWLVGGLLLPSSSLIVGGIGFICIILGAILMW